MTSPPPHFSGSTGMSRHTAWKTEPLRALFVQAHATWYPARSIVSAEGDRATHVLLIEEGSAALTKTSANGKELILAIRTAGSILGATAATLGRTHTVSIETLSRSRVRALDAAAFLRAIREHAELSRSANQMYCREIEELRERIAGLAPDTPRQRLMDFFRKVSANSPGSTARVRLPFSQGELTRYIAASRQTLNVALQDMENERIVRRSKGIYVVDRKRLSAERAAECQISDKTLSEM